MALVRRRRRVARISGRAQDEQREVHGAAEYGGGDVGSRLLKGCLRADAKRVERALQAARGLGREVLRDAHCVRDASREDPAECVQPAHRRAHRARSREHVVHEGARKNRAAERDEAVAEGRVQRDRERRRVVLVANEQEAHRKQAARIEELPDGAHSRGGGRAKARGRSLLRGGAEREYQPGRVDGQVHVIVEGMQVRHECLVDRDEADEDGGEQPQPRVQADRVPVATERLRARPQQERHVNPVGGEDAIAPIVPDVELDHAHQSHRDDQADADGGQA